MKAIRSFIALHPLIPFFDLAVGQCEIKRDEKEIPCIMQFLSVNVV